MSISDESNHQVLLSAASHTSLHLVSPSISRQPPADICQTVWGIHNLPVAADGCQADLCKPCTKFLGWLIMSMPGTEKEAGIRNCIYCSVMGSWGAGLGKLVLVADWLD